MIEEKKNCMIKRDIINNVLQAVPHLIQGLSVVQSVVGDFGKQQRELLVAVRGVGKVLHEEVAVGQQ